MKSRISLLSLLLFLAGCAQQLKPGMMPIYSQPQVQVEKDLDADFGEYLNFAVHPTAKLDSSSKMNPLIEKQLLFALRNRLESFGYRYVDNIEEADFYLGMYYSNEHKSTYIPPTVSTIPWYVPGQTQTTYMNLYGSTGSHWGTATTTTPGYYIPMTYTTPGQFVGAYYPCISANMFDKSTNRVVWSARAVVSTPENNVSLSGQWLLNYLLVTKEGKPSFPFRSDSRKRQDDLKRGVFGCGFLVLTLDGNNFYPVITAVWAKSPTDRAGLKVYDIITEIDAKSTLNLPRSKIRAMFDRNTGDDLMLTVNRDSKSLNVSLVAEDEKEAQSKWQKAKGAGSKGVITMTAIQAQELLGNIDRVELFNLIP